MKQLSALPTQSARSLAAPARGPLSRWRWGVTITVAATSLLPLALSVAGCEGSVSAPGGDDAGCTYQGQHLDIGEQVSMDDGCNVCQCSDVGLACSVLPCPMSAAGCQVDSALYYDVGESWPSCVDCDCPSECSCLGPDTWTCDDGACSDLVCESEGVWYRPGESYEWYDDTCTCRADGSFECMWTEDPSDECFDEQGLHEPGESWELCPACECSNVCTCLEGGSIACTDDAQCDEAP